MKSSILGPWIVGFSYVREKVALAVCLPKARIFFAGERSGSSGTAASESFTKERIRPVEYDEDGGYVYVEVRPCAGCGKLLCACCDQFHCDGCGHRFCIDHLVSVPDGTPTPLHCCPECAAECEQLALPAPLPPIPAMQLPIPAEAA